MRVVSWIDGVRGPARPRHCPKGAGSIDGLDDGGDGSTGDPRLSAYFMEVARVAQCESCDESDRASTFLKCPDVIRPSLSAPRVLIGSDVVGVRNSCSWSKTMSATGACTLPPDANRRAVFAVPEAPSLHPGIAHAMATANLTMHANVQAHLICFSEAEGHARTTKSNNGLTPLAMSNISDPRLKKHIGSEEVARASANAGAVRDVVGSNEVGTDIRPRSPVETFDDDRVLENKAPGSDLQSMLESRSSLSADAVWSFIEYGPTSAPIQEVEHSSARIEFPRDERPGVLVAERLHVVVHSEEHGDVGVQIAIREDGAHVGIVSTSDIVSAIARDQSSLESRIQSSTGLITVVSVNSSDEMGMPGLPANESGNGWRGHESKSSGNGAAEREDPPKRSVEPNRSTYGPSESRADVASVLQTRFVL